MSEAWTAKDLRQIPLFRFSLLLKKLCEDNFCVGLVREASHMDSRRAFLFKERERGSATSSARTPVMRDKELRLSLIHI